MLFDNTQVRTFNRRCNSRAICTCATVVKSGDDVFVIDQCGQRARQASEQPIRVYLFRNGDLSPGTAVYRLDEGRKFKVNGLHGRISLLHCGGITIILGLNLALITYFSFYIFNCFKMYKYNDACEIMIF